MLPRNSWPWRRQNGPSSWRKLKAQNCQQTQKSRKKMMNKLFVTKLEDEIIPTATLPLLLPRLQRVHLNVPSVGITSAPTSTPAATTSIPPTSTMLPNTWITTTAPGSYTVLHTTVSNSTLTMIAKESEQGTITDNGHRSLVPY